MTRKSPPPGTTGRKMCPENFRKYQQVDQLKSQGMTEREAIKRVGVTSGAYFSYKVKYGPLIEAPQPQRIATPEVEEVLPLELPKGRQ